MRAKVRESRGYYLGLLAILIFCYSIKILQEVILPIFIMISIVCIGINESKGW